jgi:hypothetical protein
MYAHVTHSRNRKNTRAAYIYMYYCGVITCVPSCWVLALNGIIKAVLNL